MKKIEQKVAVALLSLLVISSVPSVASAAWYNPFTWFQSEPQVEVVSLEEQTAAVVATQPEPEKVIEYIEKPVIKEVIKTVTQTVEDPLVRQQLNDALVKNTQLGNQVQQYQNLIKQYEVANRTLNSKYADAVGVAAQCVAQLKSQPSYTPPSTVRCTSSYSTHDGTTHTICN